jgi:hypothetical protein
MKKTMLVAAVMLGLGAAPGSAEAQSRPGGCLKYGLGGGVAGHFAGGHRIKGALAGCALGIYQRRKYEREVREQNRNRSAERGRSPGQEHINRYENQDQNAERRHVPNQEGTRRYEDLGLDLDRDRRTSNERASRPQNRMGNSSRDRDGYESGGSFARGQPENRYGFENQERAADPRWPWSYGPEETGSFLRAPGRVY